MKYIIDAKNKKIGRVASEAAVLLMGKKTPDFKKNTVKKLEVHITNTALMDINSKKLTEKKYVRYSGYPGGLKENSLKKLIEDKGRSEAVKRAVYGMLPHNKLRSKMIKNLTVAE